MGGDASCTRLNFRLPLQARVRFTASPVSHFFLFVPSTLDCFFSEKRLSLVDLSNQREQLRKKTIGSSETRSGNLGFQRRGKRRKVRIVLFDLRYFPADLGIASYALFARWLPLPFATK